MKKTLFALVLMAGSTFAQDPYPVGAGAGGPGYDPSAGAYPAPGPGAPGTYPADGGGGYGAPAGAYAAPAVCGPGSVWIDGYTDANGYFVNGYCAVPPYAGAYWVAPGFFGGRFVAGYWGRGGPGYRLGYGPAIGFRGGYGRNYAIRGGYTAGAHFSGGYGNGFRAPAAAAPSVRAPAANSFRSQGSYRGGGSALHGGGSGPGGRREARFGIAFGERVDNASSGTRYRPALFFGLLSQLGFV